MRRPDPAAYARTWSGRALQLSGAVLTLLLCACSLAPPLKTPQIPTADAYKELGPWTQAQPADRLPRDRWWGLYDNAELDQLQQRLIAGNPTLAAALANYAQARALSDQARAIHCRAIHKPGFFSGFEFLRPPHGRTTRLALRALGIKP